MIEEHEARGRILERIWVLPSERVPLRAAQNRFVAERLCARLCIPPFDNAAVDGFALGLRNEAGAAAGERFRVMGEQAAGRTRSFRLAAGEALRIFTGAPLPAGAGAVQMQEETEWEADGDELVLRGSVDRGDFIRRRGGDVVEGEVLLEPGRRLGPRQLALLASQGCREISVARRPRISIVVTGSELRAPGEDLAEGEIYETNGIQLEALCRAAGAEVLGVDHCEDESLPLRRTLDQAAEGCDALLISGGMSVGSHDHVRPVLKEMGLEQVFWGVNLKPGKPFLFGLLDTRPVYGFPGNPVSVFVCFLRFCFPALLRFQGVASEDTEPPELSCRLGERVCNPGPRPHWVRGRHDRERGLFRPVGVQASHGAGGLSAANALMRMPGNSDWSEGREVRIQLLEGWLL
ncbi:MAG TPA: gephyrin-like molybdotransferase Glp [Verrucomicrobiales bacterium]|nr:gephyrin-like molybdotransferase Glp [Verrucomicrobiales bacterium]